MTFAQCAQSYIAAHRSGWNNVKHAAQWESTITTYVNPVFGALPVQSVDTAILVKALESIWKSKPETASRLRGRIESILSWATVRGLRTGENPARWRAHLDKLLPKRSKASGARHFPALPYRGMSEFMIALRKQPGVGAKALEFLILTATRTNEVIGSSWQEIDGDVWIVPAIRMKAGVEHRIPLSPRAVEIVHEMRLAEISEFVFPGMKPGRALSNMSMLAVLKRMGRGDITAHGFRSSFRDWAAEQTNYPREVAESALAHVVKNKAEAAYFRADLFEKRRLMMRDWARYCDAKTVSHAATPIRKRV